MQRPQHNSANQMHKFNQNNGNVFQSHAPLIQMNNKENEQPHHMMSQFLHIGAGNALSTHHYQGENVQMHEDHHHPQKGGHPTSAHSNGQQFQTYMPPASAKVGAMLGGTIHAPRHSFTKRSFGRDLMNLQTINPPQPHHSNEGGNNTMTNANLNGKAHLFSIPNKVRSRVDQKMVQANLKTRSYLSGQTASATSNTIQTQASTLHQVTSTGSSNIPPQSASMNYHLHPSQQTHTSVGKSKTPFESGKNTSIGGGLQSSQNDQQAKPFLPSMMQSLNLTNNNHGNGQINHQITIQRQTLRPPAVAVSQDRKGGALACLSQDRATSASNAMKANNKINLSQFGSHGTNFSQIMIPPVSQPSVAPQLQPQQTYVHHHQSNYAPVLSTQSQTRAQSAFNYNVQQSQNASQYGSNSIPNTSSNKTAAAAAQCVYCKEWKSANQIENHQKNCTYNNKENEEMKQPSTVNTEVSTKKNSLLTTMTLQDAKQKRLKAFKQQVMEQMERQVDPIDSGDIQDPQACAEFATEIFNWLRNTESDPGNNNMVSPTYMQRQEDINEKMRSILVDWLIEVHLKFKLVPESLYLTVNLIDRYLEKEQVNRQKLQLVGVTAMLIACKYEEIYPPIVKDFVYITDNAYTKEEILEMERKMLQTLDFNIQITSSFRFLERYCKVAKVESLIFNLSRYLIELSLLNCKSLRFSNSNIAASALYLSLKMTRHPNPWTELMVHHTQYTEQAVRPCAKDLFLLLQDAQTSTLEAVKKKFALPKYQEVSRIRLEHSSNNTPQSLQNGGSSQLQTQSASSSSTQQQLQQRSNLHTAAPGSRSSQNRLSSSSSSIQKQHNHQQASAQYYQYHHPQPMSQVDPPSYLHSQNSSSNYSSTGLPSIQQQHQTIVSQTSSSSQRQHQEDATMHSSSTHSQQ